jgi:tagaturonate reductase
MMLSRENLQQINKAVITPNENSFHLPERVLQFGTGVLLRCLPDLFIDNANRQGIFNGRIVVVKSTDTKNENSFQRQDNLYTVCIRGIKNGVDENVNLVSSSISRVLNANHEWSGVIECASNPTLQIVISNTTESGIQLLHEKIAESKSPVSFPGKLLAFLHARFKRFNGSAESGMVIVPTELISDNGVKLRSVIVELANYNELSTQFIEWLTVHNHFCNSLVDRIVPGSPTPESRVELEKKLGYHDDLLSVAEPYSLWAIQGNERIRNILSFAKCNSEMQVVENINVYKEIKLRLLNGTHSLSCGLAFLAGFNTVYEAMSNTVFKSFVKDLMMNEIVPSIPGNPIRTDAIAFASSVVDRFSNPYLQHKWLSISMNYTSKIRERVVPVLLKHYTSSQKPPELLSVGFAGYLLFMRPSMKRDNKFYGEYKGQTYLIDDPTAALYYNLLGDYNQRFPLQIILSNRDLWGADLTEMPEFMQSVEKSIIQLENSDALSVLSYINRKL